MAKSRGVEGEKKIEKKKRSALKQQLVFHSSSTDLYCVRFFFPFSFF